MALQSTENRPRVPLEAAVRTDGWWVKPLLTCLGLLTFVIYATWRMLENANYNAEEIGLPYLSPFYSPLIPWNIEIGAYQVSPAMLILPFPALFRATCYYYRQAYYRSFFADPLGCAIPEPGGARRKYWGERSFPLTAQNLHRYALYAALVFMFFLWYDALKAFWHHGPFVGVGSFILLANVLLLSGYTFGCHSFRHLVGGRMDCFTCPMGGSHANAQPRTGYHAWKIVTFFNENHMAWAWFSLFGVILTDLYIRSVMVGAITDIRLL